ncbi:MAG: polysaccharide deacetylase family protein [Candidatus Acidiferrum sp.]
MNDAQRPLLLTTSWDDGHPQDLRVAELLAKHGIAGTFYISRSGPRTVMSAPEIHELGETFEIGGHTLEHVSIERLSDAEAIAQLSGSRAWIEQLTGRSCRSFCFPGGKFRRRQLPFVRNAGYQVARTVELLSTANPQWADGVCLVPTTVQVFPHGPLCYAKNVLKRFSFSTAHWPRKSLFGGDWVPLATDLFLRTRERGGIFHLWGHSWEIEECREWRNLERFLETIGSCRDEWKSITNGELSELPLRPVPFESAAAPAAVPERVE